MPTARRPAPQPHALLTGAAGVRHVDGRFVDRKEGYRIQIAAAILSADGRYRSDDLSSEDLY
jgi:hypothetical protein